MSCNCDNNPLILPVGATGPQGPKGDPGFGFEHYIGEEFGGGVVFHVYRDSDGTEHGLIFSLNWISSNVYSNINNISCNALSRFDGANNTTLITNQIGCTTGAAIDCSNYSSNGYTDWYLPSIDELKLVYINQFNVNKTLSSIAGADIIGAGDYWSSTELSNNWAYAFNFSDGWIWGGGNDKSNYREVRAIRKY